MSVVSGFVQSGICSGKHFAAPASERTALILACTRSHRPKARMHCRVNDNASDRIVSPFEAVSSHESDSIPQLQLTSANIQVVLDQIRPMLQSDGGDVSLQSVDRYGNIRLVLEGACSSCSSSQTTMQLGIEKRLREAFGTQIGDIEAVEDPIMEALRQGVITAPMVDKLLDEVRPAVTAMGGVVEVEMVSGGEVSLTYSGPERLSKGIEMMLRDRLPTLEKVVFFPPDE
uniref:NIF system FeS cluster assembly NifU C-terminal domain-containing protein n=1 Tax=Timspurckia oligopyrenoides TaxID=708627 RepID=A0A6T6LKA6_9RHOD|mmetsp:Transcript_12529/g.22602  ORF Transcript_12529/g.22602 Transcript_12529/m.22602 type:complete len:230 (+) Transcript_12529:84-773(+)|eukprot:CAMPEP_0182443496 /NCGR_PEP_ID=MMETSP1172-20130603/2215_1 /TAXON_ID=708627 /ORGANISM="Timspurckia oligopyrenoides, Strain CCMP3278" /LENGTH=229 /DNA_ID=CAMNT_0024638799 /DNA_START=94 /DNA_END=783 /DNA_ORIENTATION=-